jgi:hypothetical protein
MIKFFLCFLILQARLLHGMPSVQDFTHDDLKKMESFFDYLIHNSAIGYSLCGEKPVSIETFPRISKIPLRYAIKIFINHPGYSIEWNGWNVWQTYAHFFSSKKFALRFIPECDTLVLVNKRSAKKVIEENLDLFHILVDPQKTAEEFLDELCAPKIIDYMGCHNTIILGILLGYGRNNAIAFKNCYMQKLEPLDGEPWNRYLDPFLKPGCMVINDGSNEKENAHIRQTLKLARQSLQAFFKKGHCFETFIKLFTDD